MDEILGIWLRLVNVESRFCNPQADECTPIGLSSKSLHLLLCPSRNRGKPGLVLGLDRGGFCEGVAFAAKSNDADAVMDYLRDRELVTRVYRELVLPIRLDNGAIVPAVTYVVDHSHKQYAGKLNPDHAAEIVREGHGHSGPNRDYVLNTVDHLRQMRIDDAALESVAHLIRNEQPRPKLNDGP
nr:gamma-glutamylcyclotransferase [Marinicella sp. W31]MDC2875661.1 gamma-glutamylcyclotransferase [Marinicella sp. W31]